MGSLLLDELITAAARLLADAEDSDPQELMARATGNYKNANERRARKHPRNQHD